MSEWDTDYQTSITIPTGATGSTPRIVIGDDIPAVLQALAPDIVFLAVELYYFGAVAFFFDGIATYTPSAQNVHITGMYNTPDGVRLYVRDEDMGTSIVYGSDVYNAVPIAISYLHSSVLFTGTSTVDLGGGCVLTAQNGSDIVLAQASELTVQKNSLITCLLGSDIVMKAGSELGCEAGTLITISGGGVDVNLGAWLTYAPVWHGSGSNPVVGANTTVTAKYQYLNKNTVIVKLKYVLGAAFVAGTGTISFDLPVAAADGAECGAWQVTDSGVAVRTGTTVVSGGQLQMYRNGDTAPISFASWTFNAGDTVALTLTYEV